MVESKILRDFFEEQHRKFKKRAYSILRFTQVNHAIQQDRKEWTRHKAGTTDSHPPQSPPPNGGIPPGNP